MSTESEHYTKAALQRFLNIAAAQSLMNPNTVGGYKAAVTKVLEQVPDTTDVRTVDLATEVRRYNNAHPGELSPNSLGQYQRRLQVVIAELGKYVADPTKYKGRGRSPVESPVNGKRVEVKRPKAKSTEPAPTPAAAAPTPPPMPAQVAGLSYAYPLRGDFLAQVVVPRDMKAEEARRLTRFIMTLAHDYTPSTE